MLLFSFLFCSLHFRSHQWRVPSVCVRVCVFNSNESGDFKCMTRWHCFLYFMKRIRGTAISGLTYVRPFNHYYQIHNYCCTDSAPCTWNHWKGLCVSKFTTTHTNDRECFIVQTIECEREREEMTTQCYIFLQLFVFLCCERADFVPWCVSSTIVRQLILQIECRGRCLAAVGSIPFNGRRNCHLAYDTYRNAFLLASSDLYRETIKRFASSEVILQWSRGRWFCVCTNYHTDCMRMCRAFEYPSIDLILSFNLIARSCMWFSCLCVCVCVDHEHRRQ